MEAVNILLGTVILLALALIACPSLVRLPWLWLAHRWGTPVYDRVHYWVGVSIHIICSIAFTVWSISLWRVLGCDGCSSGILTMMTFVATCIFCWSMYGFASYLISKSRERPRRGLSDTHTS